MKSNFAILQPLLVLLLIIATTVVFYYGSTFLIPLTYGIMFAFLVHPIHLKLVHLGVNKYLAAILSTLVILSFFLILLSVLGWQVQELYDQSDEIKNELVSKQQKVQDQVKNWFGISFNQQEEYVKKMIDRMQNNIGKFIGSTASILTSFLLSLIYTILLLAERTRIRQFFLKLIDDPSKARKTIEETREVIQRYLTGKLTIIGILAVIYAVSFWAAGIKYGVLLGVLAAFLTFIPYVGNIIGGALAVMITFATGGSISEVIILFVIMGVTQIIESYILTPWIIGSNVNLNPFFSIVSVIALSIIWGAAGAVIALPLVGILKVLFSHIEAYQPVSFLMGNEEVEE